MSEVVAPRPLRALRATLEHTLGWQSRLAPRLEQVNEIEIELSALRLRARLYVPADSQANPTILYFHGGGFVMSGLATHDGLCRWLAHASGMRLLAVAQRLAPEAAFPAQLEDAIGAADWLLIHAASLGITDPRLIVGGDSAGAYLAVRVGLHLADIAPQRLVMQVLLSPLVHVADASWSTQLANLRWVGRGAVAYMRRALGAAPFATLLDLPLRRCPPTVLIAGEALDPVGVDAAALADALEEAGVRVERRRYRWLIHGGLNLTRTSALAVRTLTEAGRLLRHATTAPPR